MMYRNPTITIYESLKAQEALERIYSDNIEILPFGIAFAIKRIINELEIVGETVADMLDVSHEDAFLNDIIEVPTHAFTLTQLLSVEGMQVNMSDVELIAKLLPTN